MSGLIDRQNWRCEDRFETQLVFGGTEEPNQLVRER